MFHLDIFLFSTVSEYIIEKCLVLLGRLAGFAYLKARRGLPLNIESYQISN